MTRVRTFIDSGVLITAATGNHTVAIRAMEILDDPTREFITSDFVRLEVLPKPMHFGKKQEAEFYHEFFRGTTQNVAVTDELVSDAFEEAVLAGLSAVDALHVAAAKRGKSDEFVTSEKRTKPLFRAADIMVTTIQPH